MDNSRKNDSIATKTHPQKTAVNQQQMPIYDQNQQPGEMLAGHGMATTGAAIKTEAIETKMSADNIGVGVGGVQRDQSSVDTTGIVKESFWENFAGTVCCKFFQPKQKIPKG